MHRFCRLPLEFDPARLQEDLARVALSRWVPHYVPSNYAGEWSAIPLRSVGGQADHALPDPAASLEAYRDTPILAECDYLQQVLASFHCPVASARLLKLAAGSHIKEHTDHDLSANQGWARLHVPLVTHARVEFYVESERVVMGEGECWYIDASLPHRLANPGPVDRIHLVFDCRVNDWLRQQMADAGYRPRELGYFEARGVQEQSVASVIAALRGMGTETGDRLAAELEQKRMEMGERQ